MTKINIKRLSRRLATLSWQKWPPKLKRWGRLSLPWTSNWILLQKRVLLIAHLPSAMVWRTSEKVQAFKLMPKGSISWPSPSLKYRNLHLISWLKIWSSGSLINRITSLSRESRLCKPRTNPLSQQTTRIWRLYKPRTNQHFQNSLRRSLKCRLPLEPLALIRSHYNFSRLKRKKMVA